LVVCITVSPSRMTKPKELVHHILSILKRINLKCGLCNAKVRGGTSEAT
jgi:hypothetical protein